MRSTRAQTITPRQTRRRNPNKIRARIGLAIRRGSSRCVSQMKRAEMAREASTSQGVWHPRYMRENPTRMTTAKKRNFMLFLEAWTPREPYRQAALWVWPLGKEYPVAAGTALSTGGNAGSSTQGRGMRKVTFSVCTASPARK